MIYKIKILAITLVLTLSVVSVYHSPNALALVTATPYKCNNIAPPSTWLADLKSATNGVTATVGTTATWYGDFTSAGRIIWYRDNSNYSTIILKATHANIYVDTGLADSNNATDFYIQNAPTANQFTEYFKIVVNNDYTINSVITDRTSGTFYKTLIRVPNNSTSTANQSYCIRSSYNFNSNSSYNIALTSFLKFPYAGTEIFTPIQFESAPPSTGGGTVTLSNDSITSIAGIVDTNVVDSDYFDNWLITATAIVLVIMISSAIIKPFAFRGRK